jgi:hypothetical protein
MLSLTSADAPLAGSGHDRAVRILAHSILRELTRQGCDLHHIVGLASELIDLACECIRSHHAPGHGPDGHQPNQTLWKLAPAAHHSIDLSSYAASATNSMEAARPA